MEGGLARAEGEIRPREEGAGEMGAVDGSRWEGGAARAASWSWRHDKGAGETGGGEEERGEVGSAGGLRPGRGVRCSLHFSIYCAVNFLFPFYLSII